MNGVHCGRTGLRASGMPACCGVRPPLRRLHSWQEQTTFSQTDTPPWERGNDMIEIEFLARQSPAAVLAGAFIAGVDIIAAEAHLALGHAVVAHQQDHPRHANDAIDHADGLVVGGDREIAPAVEIEGLILFVDRFGDALVEQHEGAPNRSDMDRQIGPIEDQDLGIENRIT